MNLIHAIMAAIVLFAAAPATTNYKLNSFGFGNGGTAGSSTANYKMEGITGEISSDRDSTSNYKLKPGYIQTQQAHVPVAPTFTNPSNYYDKLQLIINPSANPTDAKFAISISSDNFASDTRYVKSDHTVGSSLSVTDYQTYAAWGGASGFNIIGLNSNTTYTVKVKATQGTYTESEYGPTAQAATVGQKLTFGVSPNTEAMGNLLPGTVTTGPSNITASIDTNANAGGNVYITGLNGGLKSVSANSTITSATADLSAVLSGFGVQAVSATQTSGGPLSSVAPYNGAGQNVGIVDTVLRNIFHSVAPIVGGQGVFSIKAKASNTTPAASDYSETFTVIGAAVY